MRRFILIGLLSAPFVCVLIPETKPKPNWVENIRDYSVCKETGQRFNDMTPDAAEFCYNQMASDEGHEIENKDMGGL